MPSPDGLHRHPEFQTPEMRATQAADAQGTARLVIGLPPTLSNHPPPDEFETDAGDRAQIRRRRREPSATELSDAPAKSASLPMNGHSSPASAVRIWQSA